MKRSQINEIIKYTIDAMKKAQFPLPPFAYYSLEDWKNLDETEIELVENMLGWDISDFGGDFKKVGLTIFTFRNGNFYAKDKYPKPYCEKLDYVMDGQVLPFHYHWSKREDIINRGGGDLAITLYNSSPEDFADVEAARALKKGTFMDTPVTTKIDGKEITIPAGGKVILHPGQSIAVTPGLYHSWQGVPGTGEVIVFEVSTTNDDRTDNRFYKASDRIPSIEEDVTPTYLMFADYPKYTRFDFLKKD
jgi:D-lyxose ketol-isomerase